MQLTRQLNFSLTLFITKYDQSVAAGKHSVFSALSQRLHVQRDLPPYGYPGGASLLPFKSGTGGDYVPRDQKSPPARRHREREGFCPGYQYIVKVLVKKWVGNFFCNLCNS